MGIYFLYVGRSILLLDGLTVAQKADLKSSLSLLGAFRCC